MKNIWNMGIKLKIAAGFALILIILISIQYALNKSISNVIASQQELLKSTELSTKIESIKSSVTFFESKMKGYILTGNKKLLDNNEKYLNDIVGKFKNLKSLSPNKEQIESIDKLVSLLNSEIQFADEVIFQYDIDPANSIELIKSKRSTKLMKDIISEFEKINSIEEVKFAEMIRQNQHYSKMVKLMDVSAYVLAFLVITLCILVLYRDINKREKLEEELIIAQKKAENAAVIKEQFMANMSHEIRTPMNAIIGFNKRLIKTKLDDEQREYVSNVQSAGENLLAIINDILDFSKIEAGMVKIEEVCFALPALLHSVTTVFQSQANDRDIRIKLQVSENVPQLLLGDPTRLTQILINLIGNALKFTRHGNIDIQASVKFESSKEVLIEFSVKDSGIGIPKDKLALIFERFTQAQADTTRIYGGTGLGLSIVKKLVELQKGSIIVESEENKGSSFIFSIPYKKADPVNYTPTGDQEKISVNTNAKNKILIVEDNILNQKLAGFILKDMGYDHVICGNGKLAIDELNRNHYDLILMDIQMPEMNGYDTTIYIREQMKLNIPIIAMTAHALPGEKEKCISFGMTDYISKPINDVELSRLIAKYLIKINC